MRVSRGWLLASLMAACTGRVAAQHGWVALVTSCQGDATVAHGDTTEMARPLTHLAAGDRLDLKPGARVTVTWLRGGRRFILTGPGQDVVGATDLEDAAGHSKPVGQAPAQYQASYMPRGTSLERLGGMATRGAPPVPEMAFTVASPVLDLHFLDSPPLTGYDVKIVDGEHHRTVLHLPGTTTRLVLDEATLRRYAVRPPRVTTLLPGARYLVDITAYHVSGPQDGATYVVRMLSGKEQTRLSTAEKAAVRDFDQNPSDATPLTLLSAFYEDQGGLMEADRTLTSVADRQPAAAAALAPLRAEVETRLDRINQAARDAHQAGAGEI